MADDDKPFGCEECGMSFTNEDHLAVHMRKHDMSLALNLSAPGMLSPTLGAFTDQTPTPTKFLKNLEEMGLFQELTKNPFDDSFKKAMDESLDHSTMAQISLPITDPADLDTPQPPLPRIVIDEDAGIKGMDKAKDTLSSIVPKKRKKFLRQQSMPTSTTSEDESESVIGSSSMEIGSAPLETEGVDSSDVLQLPPPSVQESISSTQASVRTNLVLSAPSPAPVVTSTIAVEPQTTKAQAQQMVQVLLQLPGGQTVPIQVPASNIVSPKQAGISTQPVVQNNIPPPKQQQLIQTVPQNTGVQHLLVTGNQPVLQNMQGTVLSPQQTIVKPTPQPNIPMTVRTITLGTSQVLTNQPSTVQNVLAPDTNNMKTILAADKPGSFKTVMIQSNAGAQNAGLQPNQNVITVSPPRVNLVQRKVQSGSQAYTKQRLKAALQQQQAAALGNQKISHILQANEIKQELRAENDNQSVVSSTGSVSSPEERPYTLLSGNQSLDPLEDPDSRRKKFLERNRAAAARCRQKRKYWITNLESKAEELSSQNSKLCGEVKALRGEVAQLKTLLLAHKDCPVTMQQRSQGQITSDTFKMDKKTTESAYQDIIEIIDDKPETTKTTTASLPSVILPNGVEKTPVSTTNTLVQNVIPVNNLPLNNNNNMTVPNIITLDGQTNGTPASVGQYVIPQFVNVNQPTVQENQKGLSVITGPNTIGLIPKLFNLDQLVQTNNQTT